MTPEKRDEKLRQEFEKWYGNRPINRRNVSWEVWQAAYALGQQEEREACALAVHPEDFIVSVKILRRVPKTLDS